MGLNKQTGNMYSFVTHTWNTVKGACPHQCSYCYMKRWGDQQPLHFNEKELHCQHGTGKFIFVGSSCDLFADAVPQEWIDRTLRHCQQFHGNAYLLQSKNPARILACKKQLPDRVTVGTTIETNRMYKEIMGTTPSPEDRVTALGQILGISRFVTIEPILDFDLEAMVALIQRCRPDQVNIGADSGGHSLPEPPVEKVLQLIDRCASFTTVVNKRNLSRLLS